MTAAATATAAITVRQIRVLMETHMVANVTAESVAFGTHLNRDDVKADLDVLVERGLLHRQANTNDTYSLA